MAGGGQRIDKWLWFARFAKTRTLAAKLAESGLVRVNGQRVAAASRQVAPGDVLTIAAPHVTAVVRVLAAGERRGPASEARLLYEPVDRDPAALVTGDGGR